MLNQQQSEKDNKIFNKKNSIRKFLEKYNNFFSCAWSAFISKYKKIFFLENIRNVLGYNIYYFLS